RNIEPMGCGQGGDEWHASSNCKAERGSDGGLKGSRGEHVGNSDVISRVGTKGIVRHYRGPRLVSCRQPTCAAVRAALKPAAVPTSPLTLLSCPARGLFCLTFHRAFDNAHS